jgi:hypothetical protein
MNPNNMKASCMIAVAAIDTDAEIAGSGRPRRRPGAGYDDPLFWSERDTAATEAQPRPAQARL